MRGSQILFIASFNLISVFSLIYIDSIVIPERPIDMPLLLVFIPVSLPGPNNQQSQQWGNESGLHGGISLNVTVN